VSESSIAQTAHGDHGSHDTSGHGAWYVGIAYSTTPAGPWHKSPQNPILPATVAGGQGFYMGSVLQVCKHAVHNTVARPSGYRNRNWRLLDCGRAANTLNQMIPHCYFPSRSFALTQYNGSFRMYVEAPITYRDQGPMAVYIAPRPEGPYTVLSKQV
jgi:hypothetical protein